MWVWRYTAYTERVIIKRLKVRIHLKKLVMREKKGYTMWLGMSFSVLGERKSGWNTCNIPKTVRLMLCKWYVHCDTYNSFYSGQKYLQVTRTRYIGCNNIQRDQPFGVVKGNRQSREFAARWVQKYHNEIPDYCLIDDASGVCCVHREDLIIGGAIDPTTICIMECNSLKVSDSIPETADTTRHGQSPFLKRILPTYSSRIWNLKRKLQCKR